MQRLEVSCAVRPIYGSLGAKGLIIVTLENCYLYPDTDYMKWYKITEHTDMLLWKQVKPQDIYEGVSEQGDQTSSTDFKIIK
jgi:hypothetical protein